MARTLTFGLALLALMFFIRAQAQQQAQASDGTHNAESGSQATQEDWDELFAAVGNLNATMAGAAEAVMSSDESWREDECRYQSLNRPLWTAREELLTAQCAVDRWSVPGGLAEFSKIASCESGWNRWANNAGRYLGIFQHAASAYVSRINAYNPPAWQHPLSTRWSNSRGQIVMSARYMHANGTGAWSCA